MIMRLRDEQHDATVYGLIWAWELNRFPYAKRPWPNAAHSATRRGQMRDIAPRLVAKCGAAAHGSC